MTAIDAAPLRLHIGGRKTHPDWKILDALPRPEVDYVCNAANLEQFAANSVEAIYASHVLEHFYFGLNNELTRVLTEWCRVLKPDAPLYISVPDLQKLCWLYLRPDNTVRERFHIMKMMFGSQADEYDIHRVGLDFESLQYFLHQAGFTSMELVEAFNFFDDTSSLHFLGVPISLNVVAYK
jgi:predicted SAM-dependent methyltransferase